MPWRWAWPVPWKKAFSGGNNKAAHRKHREGKTLAAGCIEFAEYFVDSVWQGVFRSKDPTLQEQRRAGAIYRFALLEAYRERGIPETDNGASGARPRGVRMTDKNETTEMLDKFSPYLNDGDLTENVVGANGKNTYVLPARRNAGHLAIAVIREVIAPTVFRNAEEEVTDIEDRDWRSPGAGGRPASSSSVSVAAGCWCCGRGKVGGRMPQNRTAVGEKMPVGKAFDLNTLVFGDSAMRGTQVLPVKAAVQYSDALSVKPYRDAVGESFHHRGDETGTLWDGEKKKNTANLFTRHFVLPETLLVQVLTSSGRQLPADRAGSLAAQLGLGRFLRRGKRPLPASTWRTHIAGVFGARLESPVSSPYELLRALGDSVSADASVEALACAIGQAMSKRYPMWADWSEASAHQQQLIQAFEEDAPALRARYQKAAPKIAALFEGHFGPK